MAELISGPTMILTWTYSGGTISLNGDYRNVDWDPSTTYEDVSAGQDTQIGKMPVLKDATAVIELVTQTGGTAIAAALQPQTAGTLVVQPEGTATNKRKITFPSYCDGAKLKFPYANVSVITCGFTGSSVLANFTDGVN